MAKRAFCDGCGEEIAISKDKEYRVLIEGHDVSHLSDTFDLCSGCARTIVERANPKKWPRFEHKAA